MTIDAEFVVTHPTFFPIYIVWNRNPAQVNGILPGDTITPGFQPMI